MKLIALMAARNESWIIGASLRAVLMYCDEAVVLNHASTDNTGNIVLDVAEENPGRVHMIFEGDPEWREMNHRQRLLDAARARHGTHFVYCDADEILTGNLIPHIRRQIETLPKCGFLQVGMPCIWRSLNKWRDDTSVFGRALTMLAFCDSPSLGWKPKADGYQFHSREPNGARCTARLSRDCGGQMHLQWVSWRRLVAKQTWYQMVERVMYPQKPIDKIAQMYSHSMNEAGINLADTPADWWEPYGDLIQHIDGDSASWHEIEIKRMIDQYGDRYFSGLNLAFLDNDWNEIRKANCPVPA